MYWHLHENPVHLSYTIYFVDNSSIPWLSVLTKIQLPKASAQDQTQYWQNQADFYQCENGSQNHKP